MDCYYDAQREEMVPFVLPAVYEAEEVSEAADDAHEVGLMAWRDLLWFVIYGARELSACCALFGRACLVVRPGRYRALMRREELRAVEALGTVRWERERRTFKGMSRVIDERMEMMRGHASLGSLVGECERRREALDAILMAAWRDARSGVYAESLAEAFGAYVAMASQDRGLMAWVSQTELARAFDETRAAMCARVRREVKQRVSATGARGVTVAGGKSASAIKVYSEVQRGNTSRASVGWSEEVHEERERERVRLRAEHGDVPVRGDVPRDPRALRAYLDGLHEAAEMRRLGL